VVTVHLDNATNLWAIDLRLVYDPISCLGMTPGTIPSPDYVIRNDCGNGAVDYTVVQQSPRAPANGSGSVVSLTFQCTRAGTTPLHFQHAVLLDNTGNQLPVIPSDGQITCTSQASILGYHYVRYGEGLLCIARAYGVSAWAIANQNWLYYPYILYPGQRLAIPNVPYQNPPGPVCVPQFGVGTTPTPPFIVTPTPTPISGSTCRAYYQVRYGDTLYAIAWRYGTTISAIATRNNIINPNWIWAGQWLCIP
jgi:LysM repeat protein